MRSALGRLGKGLLYLFAVIGAMAIIFTVVVAANGGAGAFIQRQTVAGVQQGVDYGRIAAIVNSTVPALDYNKVGDAASGVIERIDRNTAWRLFDRVFGDDQLTKHILQSGVDMAKVADLRTPARALIDQALTSVQDLAQKAADASKATEVRVITVQEQQLPAVQAQLDRIEAKLASQQQGPKAPTNFVQASIVCGSDVRRQLGVTTGEGANNGLLRQTGSNYHWWRTAPSQRLTLPANTSFVLVNSDGSTPYFSQSGGSVDADEVELICG